MKPFYLSHWPNLRITFVLATALVANLYACDPPKQPIVSNPIYEPCCGADTVEYYYIDGSYVYVPNVFTPNGDGVNDLFYPIVNDTILEVTGFTIYTAVGDTGLFFREDFNYSNLANHAWNGNRMDDGQPYIGLFKYRFTALSAHYAFPIEGYACRVACGPEAAIFQTKEGCFYPSQIGQDGHLNGNIISGESGCFE